MIWKLFTFYDGKVCNKGAHGMPVVVDQEQILIGRKKYERDASLGKSLNDIVKRYELGIMRQEQNRGDFILFFLLNM